MVHSARKARHDGARLRHAQLAMELLLLAKKYHPIPLISDIVGEPANVLRGYMNGRRPIAPDKARSISNSLLKIMRLEKLIEQRMTYDELGFFDNTRIIGDTFILELAAADAALAFAGHSITKCLVPAVDGLPFATLIARNLGVDVVIAKGSKEVGVKEFIEEVYIPAGTGMMVSFYVPRSSLRKNDSVLIVDDVIDTGETQIALSRMIEFARAKVGGICALVSVGTDWALRLNTVVNCPVKINLRIETRPRQTWSNADRRTSDAARPGS